MRRNSLVVLILSIGLLALTGCSTVFNKAGYVKKEQVEQQIAQLKVDRESAVSTREKEISYAKDQLLKQVKDNFQETSNYLYGAKLASDFKANKLRIDNLIDYRLNTAISFAPAPTAKAIQEQMVVLRQELDEARVTNEDLKKKYDAKVQQADLAKADELKKEAQITQKEREKTEQVAFYTAAIEKKQLEYNKVNDDLITKEAQRADKAQSEESLKKTLIYILAALGALCAVGAYFLRSIECVIGAAVCIGLAMAIPLIKPWMVITGLISAIVILSIPFIKKYLDEKDMADRSIGAVQEIRNESEMLYQKKIKPKLDDWFEDRKNLHDKVETKIRRLNLK